MPARQRCARDGKHGWAAPEGWRWALAWVGWGISGLAEVTGGAGPVGHGQRLVTSTPVERGTPGTLSIRRDDPGLFLGYLDGETIDAPTGDWFQTGDIVELRKFDPKVGYGSGGEYIRRDGTGTTDSWQAATIKGVITYVLGGGHFGIEPGTVVLGLPKIEVVQ